MSTTVETHPDLQLRSRATALATSTQPHDNPQYPRETENKLYVHVPKEEIHCSPLR